MKLSTTSVFFGIEGKCRTFGAHFSFRTAQSHALTGVATDYRPFGPQPTMLKRLLCDRIQLESTRLSVKISSLV
jgi:hypothetical protein